MNSNRNLLFVNATLSHGGAERVISILTNKLVEDGYSVTILTWLNSPVFYQFDDRINIISVEHQVNSKNVIKKMLWLRKFVRRSNPDLVMSFLAIFNILTLICLIGIKVKVVVCERNDPRYTPFRKSLRLLRNFMYILSTGVLTQSESNKTYYPRFIRDKIDVIYNPIYLEKELVGSGACHKTNKVIISIARLTPQKNQKMLIDAFSIFHETNPDYKLLIYGEGTERSNLENYCFSKGLNDSVVLAGVTKDVFGCLKNAEIFVLSSFFEGMPNTLLEAMCVGLPCISTKVSGAIDLIKDGENGYLVDLGDYQTLAERMADLARDDEKKIRMGINASKLYSKLNVDDIVSEWECYINKIIEL